MYLGYIYISLAHFIASPSIAIFKPMQIKQITALAEFDVCTKNSDQNDVDCNLRY
jgi:hypothetical protein